MKTEQYAEIDIGTDKVTLRPARGTSLRIATILGRAFDASDQLVAIYLDRVIDAGLTSDDLRGLDWSFGRGIASVLRPSASVKPAVRWQHQLPSPDTNEAPLNQG